MQTTNNLKRLISLGLKDEHALTAHYETLAQSFIESVPIDDVPALRGILERAVDRRLESLRNLVKSKHCLEPNHWLLEHGDRKIIVRKMATNNALTGRNWRVYEAKFSKDGVLSKGRMTGNLTLLGGITSVKWEFLLGRI
jgi:hypothetical protein